MKRYPHAIAVAVSALCCGPAWSQAAPAADEQTLGTVTVKGAAHAPALALDEPSSTGSRLGLTPRETPASVTVVDREAIAQRGAANTQEILRGVPGITAASPPGSAGSVFYRGFGSSSLTQLFNGITTQYDAIAARPVDSWIYERVEAIGGPSTYLFGAGAVGGSINYITKTARRDGDFSEGQLRYGSFGTVDAAIGLNRRLGSGEGVKNFARLDVNRSRSSGFVQGEKRNAINVAASLLTDVNPRWSHLLAVEYQHEKADRPYWGTPLLNPATGPGRIDRATRFVNYNAADGVYEQDVKWLRSELSYKLSPHTTLKNTLYHYSALRDYRNVETYRFNPANTAVLRSAAFLQRHDQQLTGNRLEWAHQGQLAGHASDWSAGVDYSHNTQTRFPLSLSAPIDSVNPYAPAPIGFFDVPGMKPGFNPDRTNTVRTLALFLENRTRLTPQLALVSGLRHDRIDLTGTNHRAVGADNPAFFKNRYQPTTGRLGLVYELTPQANVYVQYSTAADPPAGVLTTAAFSQVRDFDLTSGRQIEVGSKFDYLDGRGTATLALYQITRKNLAIADPNQPGSTLPVGEQSSRGIEVATAFRPNAAWLLQGNLSYTDARYENFVENVGGQAISRAGMRPNNIPAWVGNLWLRWKPAPQWELGVDGRLVSRRYANTANTLWDSGYALWGASVSYQVHRNARLTLRARNLGNTTYAASVGSGSFYLGAPRAFDLTLHAAF
ncbi:TonB-dependent receptor [Ottowia testudinis]|uniref:TonB-dependent receptor n=1 Tax=Ottowia testudinis TaxID=2816950 RepID=A0A975CHQ0_9BURK|nr:TonB-dependent receptor [Ottowia testudinis]QTD45127.1 TonB-dependent receptor [Ottowia testudinis]